MKSHTARDSTAQKQAESCCGEKAETAPVRTPIAKKTAQPEVDTKPVTKAKGGCCCSE